jgi:dynein heavy chain
VIFNYVLIIFLDASLSSSIMISKWIVLDGAMERSRFETLNSLLEEDGKLYLSSGEVIRAAPRTNLIVETVDIEEASPATV